MLDNLLISKLDEYCPLKEFKFSSQDNKCIIYEIKRLHRLRQKEYIKNGKSLKYKNLSDQFDKKYAAAAERYLRRNIDDLKETKPGKAYKILK